MSSHCSFAPTGPSEGLGLQQICEGIRGAGLAPILFQSSTPEEDRPQLWTYIRSGFPPILCVMPLQGNYGHAVCATGLKRVQRSPRTNPNLHFSEAATALKALYVHDDRLGPYAVADLYPYTVAAPPGSNRGPSVRSALRIRWPEEQTEEEHVILTAFVIPVPLKLRLSATRMREVGLVIAEFAGQYMATHTPDVVLDCRYATAVAYKRSAFGFGLTAAGLETLLCKVPLSRYIGVIEIFANEQPLFDAILDSTETYANPSVIALVARSSQVPLVLSAVTHLARHLNAVPVT